MALPTEASPLRATWFLLASLVLLALPAEAYHADCPATTATVTLRLEEGGYYLLVRSASVFAFEETNGHSGLQMGDLPLGCWPDTAVW